MPLADVVGGVACLAQLGCDGGQILLEAQAVMPHTGFSCVTPREHDRARWAADRLVGNCMREVGAFRGKRIEVGRARGTVEAICADKIPTELVGMIDDDIRFLPRRRFLRDAGLGGRGIWQSGCRTHGGRAYEKVSAIYFQNNCSSRWCCVLFELNSEIVLQAEQGVELRKTHRGMLRAQSSEE